MTYDIHAVPPPENPDNYYLSPWKKNEHGERKCIEVTYNPTQKTITVRQLAQTRLNRLAAFILGTKRDDRYAHTKFTDEKVFNNIELADFKAKKENLEKLVNEKDSVEEIIKQIEKQLAEGSRPKPADKPLPTRPTEEVPAPATQQPTAPAAAPVEESEIEEESESTLFEEKMVDEEHESSHQEINEEGGGATSSSTSSESSEEEVEEEVEFESVIPPSQSQSVSLEEEPNPASPDVSQSKKSSRIEESTDESISAVEEEVVPENEVQEEEEGLPFEEYPVHDENESTLAREEVKRRKKQLFELRKKLDLLDQEIKATNCGSMKKIHDSISKIQDRIKSTFKDIQTLQGEVEKSGEKVETKINTLAQIAQLDQLSNIVHQAREIIVLELHLESQADQFTRDIAAFPDNLKEEWETFLDTWKAEAQNLAPNMEKLNARKQKLEDGMVNILNGYRDHLMGISQKRKEELTQKAKAAGVDFDSDVSQATPFMKFQRSLLMQRIRAWDELIDKYKAEKVDLKEIQRQSIESDALAVGDLAILKLITPEDKAPIMKFYDKVVARPANLIFATQDDLVNKLFETDSLYIDKIIDSINLMKKGVKEVLENINLYGTVTEANERLAKYQEAFDPKKLYLKGIEDYLKEFEEIVFTFLENNRGATPNDLSFVNNKWMEVYSIFNALPTLVEGEKSTKEQFERDVKEQYNFLFSKDNHPQLRKLAEQSLDKILNRAGGYGDLSTYYSRKPNSKFQADEQMELIAAADRASKIYEKYSNIARGLDIEKTFTGPERVAGYEALEELNRVLDRLGTSPGTPVDLTLFGVDHILNDFSMDLENALERANERIEQVKEVEKKKTEIRKKIEAKVAEYEEKTEIKKQQLAELEEKLDIELGDVKIALNRSIAALRVKMEFGQFSKKSLAKATMQRIGELTLWYERKPEGIFEVDELSLYNLNEYLEQLQTDIEVEKKSLDDELPIDKLSELIESKNKKIDAANQQIADLKSDISKKNPSQRKLERLQFANASFLNRGIAEVQQRTQEYLQAKSSHYPDQPDTFEPLYLEKSLRRPNPIHSIIGQIESDNQAIDYLVRKSKTTSTMSLLEQIKKLEDDKDHQLGAKKALLESQTAKMNLHAEKTSRTMEQLGAYRGIHTEAKKLLEQSQNQFAERFARTPLATRAAKLHARSLSPDDRGELPAPEPEELNYRQLKAFEKELNETIARDENELNTLKRVYEKAAESDQKLEEETENLRSKIEELDANDQLIKKAQLESILEELETITPEEHVTELPPQSFFARWFGKKPTPIYGPSAALEKHAEANGKKIGVIIAALSKADAPLLNKYRKPITTLSEQLNSVSVDDPLYDQLKHRIISRSHEMLETTVNELTAFDNLTDKVLRPLFLIEQKITEEIKAEVTTKTNELSKLKSKYTIPRGWFSCFRVTKFDVSDLHEKAHLADYHKSALDAVASAKKIKDKYPIEKFIKAHNNYAAAKTKIESEIKSYIDEGFYEYAYRLEASYRTYVKDHESTLHKKDITLDTFIKLGEALEKTTDKLLLPILKTVSGEVELLKAIDRKLSIEDQLKTFADHLKKPIGGDEKLVETYIANMKTDISNQIQERYQEHKDFLSRLTTKVEPDKKNDPIDELCERFNLSRRLKQEAHKAVINEQREFKEETPRIAVGTKLLILKSAKSVETMKLNELIQTRPLETIERRIADSEANIAANVDIKGLEKTAAAFDEALEKTEKLHKQLEKDNSLGKSVEISDLIKRMKGQVERYGNDKPPQTKEDVDNLIEYVTDTITKLNEGIASIINRREGSLVDEIKRIQKINPKSPHLETLKTALIVEISQTITSHQNELDRKLDHTATATDERKKLSEVDKLLKRKDKSAGRGVIASIASELHPPTGWLEAFTFVIKERLVPYSDLKEPQMIDGKKVEIDKLPISKLIELKDQLDIRVKENNTILHDLRFDQLEKEVFSYVQEIRDCISIKEAWQKQWRIDAAKEVDDLIARVENNIRNHFLAGLDHQNPSGNIRGLKDCLQQQKNLLAEGIRSIRNAMPATQGMALQKLDENSADYKQLKAALINSCKEKLDSQVTALDSYEKSVEKINDSLDSLFDGDIRIPIDWANGATNYIEDNISQVRALEKSFAPASRDKDNNLSFKPTPIEKLSREQLLEYESVVDKLTGLAKKGRMDTHQNLNVAVDQRLNLRSIQQAASTYATMVADVKKAVKGKTDPRVLQIKAVYKAHNRLISDAVKNMTCLSDSTNLLATLRQAQFIMGHAISKFNKNSALELDPWAKMVFDEKEIGFINDSEINKVLSDGFKINVDAKNSMDPSATFEGQSIDQMVDGATQYLTEFKSFVEKQTESFLQRGFQPTDQLITNMTSFTEQNIPNMLEEINLLKQGIVSVNPDGSQKIVPRDDMRSFDSLADYRAHVALSINKNIEQCTVIFDSMPLSLMYSTPPKPKQAQNAPPAGLAAPIPFKPPADIFKDKPAPAPAPAPGPGPAPGPVPGPGPQPEPVLRTRPAPVVPQPAPVAPAPGPAPVVPQPAPVAPVPRPAPRPEPVPVVPQPRPAAPAPVPGLAQQPTVFGVELLTQQINQLPNATPEQMKIVSALNEVVQALQIITIKLGQWSQPIVGLNATKGMTLHDLKRENKKIADLVETNFKGLKELDKFLDSCKDSFTEQLNDLRYPAGIQAQLKSLYKAHIPLTSIDLNSSNMEQILLHFIGIAGAQPRLNLIYEIGMHLNDIDKYLQSVRELLPEHGALKTQTDKIEKILIALTTDIETKPLQDIITESSDLLRSFEKTKEQLDQIFPILQQLKESNVKLHTLLEKTDPRIGVALSSIYKKLIPWEDFDFKTSSLDGIRAHLGKMQNSDRVINTIPKLKVLLTQIYPCLDDFDKINPQSQSVTKKKAELKEQLNALLQPNSLDELDTLSDRLNNLFKLSRNTLDALEKSSIPVAPQPVQRPPLPHQPIRQQRQRSWQNQINEQLNNIRNVLGQLPNRENKDLMSLNYGEIMNLSAPKPNLRTNIEAAFTQLNTLNKTASNLNESFIQVIKDLPESYVRFLDRLYTAYVPVLPVDLKRSTVNEIFAYFEKLNGQPAVVDQIKREIYPTLNSITEMFEAIEQLPSTDNERLKREFEAIIADDTVNNIEEAKIRLQAFNEKLDQHQSKVTQILPFFKHLVDNRLDSRSYIETRYNQFVGLAKLQPKWLVPFQSLIPDATIDTSTLSIKEIESKVAQLQNTMAVFNKAEDHLELYRNVTENLENFRQIATDLPAVENRYNQLVEKLKTTLKAKSEKDVEKIPERLESLNKEIETLRATWKEVEDARKEYDECCGTYDREIDHWDTSGNRNAVIELTNKLKSLSEAQEAFMKTQSALNTPAVVAKRYREDIAKLEEIMKKTALNQPAVTPPEIIEERYGDAIRPVRATLDKFMAIGKNIPVMNRELEPLQREFEKILTPATPGEAENIPSLVGTFGKKLDKALAKWKEVESAHELYTEYVENDYKEIIDGAVGDVQQGLLNARSRIINAQKAFWNTSVAKDPESISQRFIADIEELKWEAYVNNELVLEIQDWTGRERLDIASELRRIYETMTQQRNMVFKDYNDLKLRTVRFTNDLDTLKEKVNDIITHVKPEAQAPASETYEFGLYRTGVINKTKEEVANLKADIQKITDAIPSDNTNHAVRAEYLERLKDKLDQLVKGTLSITRKGFFSSSKEEKPLDRLNREELKQYEESCKEAIAKVESELKSLTQFLKILNENEGASNILSLDREHNNAIEALNKMDSVEGHYPNFFLRDLIQKTMNEWKEAARVYNDALQENSDFSSVLEKGNNLIEAYQAYKSALNQVKSEDKQPDIFDQLRMENRAPGTLSAQSKEKITQALTTYINNLLDQQKRQLTGEFNVHEDFAVVKTYLERRVSETIEKITEKLGDIDETVNSLDPVRLEDLLRKLNAEFSTKSLALNGDLKSKQLRDLTETIRINRELIEEFLTELRSENRFWIAADLHVALKEADRILEETKKIESQEEFNDYFAALQTYHTTLITQLRTLDLQKRQSKTLDEQKVYLEKTYPDSFKELIEYKQLIKARAGK